MPWFHSWYRGRVETLDAKYWVALFVGHLNICRMNLRFKENYLGVWPI